MEFIKKNKFFLILIILALVCGKLFIKGTETPDNIIKSKNPTEVVLNYSQYDDSKKAVITDKAKIEELKNLLMGIQLRQKGKPAYVNDRHLYAFRLTFNDGLVLDFKNERNLELIYKKDGKIVDKSYRVLRGVKRDEIFSLFNVDTSEH